MRQDQRWEYLSSCISGTESRCSILSRFPATYVAAQAGLRTLRLCSVRLVPTDLTGTLAAAWPLSESFLPSPLNFFLPLLVFCSRVPAQDEGLHAPSPPSLHRGDRPGPLPEAARALLQGRAAAGGFQPLRRRAGGLQVLPHRHRHQVHRRGQSQGGAGGGGRLGWEAPGRAGGQRDRGVAHLQLPEERQGHHQGRADKCLMPRRLRAGPGGRRTQAGVCSA